MARPLRIVCYAVNGSGLGHVTRLLAIARWLRRLETMVSGRPPEVVFLTSTEATSLLSEAGFAAFKLPSKGVARKSGLDVLEHRRLAKHFVWQTLAVLAPDLLVVDTFPQGSFDELLPVLDGPFKKVLVLRDVKPEFGARPVFQAALRLYDRVVVPHAPGSSAELAKLLGDRPSAWVGDVLSVEANPVPGELRSADSRNALRAELGLLGCAADGPRLVYVSAGGGGDPGSEAALAALVAPLLQRADLHLLVGAGPLYRGRRIVGPNLTWFTEPGVARYFPALDGALAAGGYNTVHELLHLGVPSAFFAQDKIADQQADRIARAVAAGAAIDLASLDPGSVIAATTRLIAEGKTLSDAASALVPHNGARIAAAQALSVLDGRDSEVLVGAAELLGPRLVQAIERLGPVGVDLLAGGLAQLDPSPRLAALSAQGALDPLLPQLSSEARAEVLNALQTRSDAPGRLAVQTALVELIEVAEASASAHLLPGLLEAALKKHPSAQEPLGASAAHLGHWAVGIARALTSLIAQGAPFTAPERAQLYRTFPRIADASHSEANALFQAMLSVNSAAHVDALLARIQAVKLQRRVVQATLAPLLRAGDHP